ncbi:hypothetical secreted protein [Brachyspira suanatina]|uniref:Hypothetical secreted protein n=1 Tax=Brachyspira suanatina TaxID=381802 RepID=A0A0G4K675_9SPIR|nr:hypothetical protein [Brachyspira suanatina]CRF32952.1 hypothetical secreted protein [Brachyspira suanatina]
MLLISASAFAASGFEVAANIPLLISIGIPIVNSDEKYEVNVGINNGITAQLEYRSYFENGIGFSILAKI